MWNLDPRKKGLKIGPMVEDVWSWTTVKNNSKNLNLGPGSFCEHRRN
jgi:hypothetical protein